MHFILAGKYKILKVSNSLILDALVAKLNSVLYFSVLFFENIDIVNVQQMLICVCCIVSIISNVGELFLLFVPLDDVRDKGTVVSLIDKLKALGIDLSKSCSQSTM